MNIPKNRILTDERTQRLNNYSQMRRDQASIKKLAAAMKNAKARKDGKQPVATGTCAKRSSSPPSRTGTMMRAEQATIVNLGTLDPSLFT